MDFLTDLLRGLGGGSWISLPQLVPLDPVQLFELRLGGVAVLIIFLATLVIYRDQGDWGDILWACHVANLMLGVGMLLNIPFVIQLAALLIIPGTAVWITEVILGDSNTPISTLAHLGGAIIAVYAVYLVGIRGGVTLYAFGFTMILQHISRFITPERLNVNMGTQIWPPWDAVFSVYWKYWVFTSLVCLICIFITELLLVYFFPLRYG